MTIARRPPALTSERVLLGFVGLAGYAVHGYVLDPERDSEGLVVELLLDGLPVQIARADQFNAVLAGEGARNPFHGFSFVIPQDLFESSAVAEVRLANDGVLIGRSLHLAQDGRPAVTALGPGHVEWHGGLRFGGWLAPDRGAASLVRGLIDGNAVVEVRPTGWTIVDQPGGGMAVPAFEFHVPTRFADARAHRIEVLSAEGVPLAPGPLTFVAFDDGLERMLAARSDVAAEQLRGALFDKLIPQSVPFEAINAWVARFELSPAGSEPAPTIGIALLGEAGLEDSLASLQEQDVAWVAGVLPWRGETAEVDPGELSAFLDGEASECDVVVFAVNGTLFQPGALGAMGAALREGGGAECAYADVIVAGPVGDQPLAFPSFDRERMLEQGYAAFFFALTREAALAAGRAGASSLFRIFDAGSGGEAGPEARPPLHVPQFLATIPLVPLDALGAALVDATRRACAERALQVRLDPLPGRRFPALRLRARPPRALVSIVIAVRNDAEALRACMAGLKAQTSLHDLEYIVVDNDSTAPETAELLSEIATDGVQIVRLRGPRNVARSCNCGAAIASGDYLLFLDQHVVLTTSDAIDEMVGRAAQPDVGAVGALLATPSGSIHDGGLVLTFRDGAVRAFAGLMVDDPGYGEMLRVAREVSAASCELMVVTRKTFLAAGGMDEVAFPLFLTAAAFCLNVRALGHRIVFTPHVRGQWNGAAARSTDPELAARFDRELMALRAAWPEDLANDPLYSPVLAANGPLYGALAWPPRDRSLRRAPPRAMRPADAATTRAAPTVGVP